MPLFSDLETFLASKHIAFNACKGDSLNLVIDEYSNNLIKGFSNKRKTEFVNGRACAISALKKLGVANPAISSITTGSIGEPIFSDEIALSISHSKDFYCAIAANKKDFITLGIDVEPTSKILSKCAFELILNEDEIEWFHKIKNNINILEPLLRLLIFSAKESAIKAFSPLLSRKLFFDFVSVFPDFIEKSRTHGVKSFNAILKNSLNNDYPKDYSFEGKYYNDAGYLITLSYLQ